MKNGAGSPEMIKPIISSAKDCVLDDYPTNKYKVIFIFFVIFCFSNLVMIDCLPTSFLQRFQALTETCVCVFTQIQIRLLRKDPQRSSSPVMLLLIKAKVCKKQNDFTWRFLFRIIGQHHVTMVSLRDSSDFGGQR